MMKQRWILAGSLVTAAALLFASGNALAAAPGHGGGGGGHAGGGGAHVGAVHAGGVAHVGAVHVGGVGVVHTSGAYHYGGYGGRGGYYGGYGYRGYGYGGVGIYLGGYPGYGYGYGGGYDAPYAAGVYSYPTYVPVPVPVAGADVPVPVPSYAAPMTPAQVQSPVTPGTGAQAPADPVAHLQIKVPADAELWIEGEKTKQTGDTREFSSPALTAGRTFVYEIKARWTEGGKEVVKTKRVPVQAGVWLGVDFIRPDEALVPPKPGTP